MIKQYITAYLIILSSLSLYAKTEDDNIVISKSDNEYTFNIEKTGITVTHVRKTEYTATRHSGSAQPHIFYHQKIRLDKASGGNMKYRDVNSPTVFHDDSKVCYFDLYLKAKDKKGKAEFRRTFIDAAHFTGVFVEDEYPIIEGNITFKIPASLEGLLLVDENFPDHGISRSEQTSADGSRIISYTITDLPKRPEDIASPPALASRPHISVRGYFADTDELYKYHYDLLKTDTTLASTPDIQQSSDRYETIANTYAYVQKNIRYVAYEEGEAAFRPDTPAETLRKRYGDCKSMSLLLATLLRKAGIEAHLAITGTNDIPWNIKDNPSLASANHAVCIVPEGDKFLVLDPTQDQISFRHTPAWLCGKDAMMITDTGYQMINFHTVSPCVSEDIGTYTYIFDGEHLYGTVQRKATEDFAQMLSADISGIPGQHLKEYLGKGLVPLSRAVIPTDSIKLETSTPGCISISAPLLNETAITQLDGISYLDLNISDLPFSSRIETKDRREDYYFPIKGKIERTSTVMIPQNEGIQLPEGLDIDYPWANLRCTFAHTGDKISLTKSLEIKDSKIPVDKIPEWNKALSQWNAACNQQIEIK